MRQNVEGRSFLPSGSISSNVLHSVFLRIRWRLKMLGGFLGRCLLLVFGYAYPAFRCFKTVEKNRVGIDELRFWCQYWIIMALVTVVERFADILISWLPFYGELKLALVIYLWHPNSLGTGNVYNNLLCPFMAKHENDIDRSLSEMRARAWDMTVLYWQHVTELAQAMFFRSLSYLATHSEKLPQISTPRIRSQKVMKKQESARLPSPKELSTPRPARFNHSSPMKRSAFLGSDAADIILNGQTTDFVYVEEHELEETVHNRPNPGHKSPPPTPVKAGAPEAKKDDSDDDFVDSNLAEDDGKEDTDRQRQRSNASGIRQRHTAAA
ncbi:hypothetical protein MLD38_020304 [Melastoma candidum]|uniref:Uncharacterized protein n=1 Tax=Melastoma candidum TaxID=119954 RepID=A0ACB9QD01_9MYRT|nr:hypothetical protein MLD38_020304 [Melastoma candidum]